MTLNGGTFNTAGLSEHGASNNTTGIGALTLQSSSIIDMASWSGTLKIYDWTGTVGTGNGTDQLYIGANNTTQGLTSAQLSDIIFYSDAGITQIAGATIQLADGEVVPVPEPSTWVAGALALAAVGYTQRRRFAYAYVLRRTS